MSGHRRARAGGISRREATYRRRRGALNAELAATADPMRRFDGAYRYARSALKSATDRGYPLTRGPGRVALSTAVRALVALGDQVLRPRHEETR